MILEFRLRGDTVPGCRRSGSPPTFRAELEVEPGCSYFYRGSKYFLSAYSSQNFRKDLLYFGRFNFPRMDTLLAKRLILVAGAKKAIALSADRTKGA